MSAEVYVYVDLIDGNGSEELGTMTLSVNRAGEITEIWSRGTGQGDWILPGMQAFKIIKSLFKAESVKLAADAAFKALGVDDIDAFKAERDQREGA